MDPAPDVAVTLHIARPPHEVRAWWTEMPADYRASDPAEQPHRIVTRSRTPDAWVVDTYWRTPLGGELRIPETFRFKPDGDWDVELRLPFGLAQRDAFVLEPTAVGTRVEIRAWIWPRSAPGRLSRPAYVAYARKTYPETWRTAARLCERDAPSIPIG